MHKVQNRNAETLFQELNAIHRLAVAAAKHEPPPAPPGNAPAPAAAAGRVGADQVTRAALVRAIRRMLALFEPVELVRQVAPGERPLARHEWDQTRNTVPKPGIY